MMKFQSPRIISSSIIFCVAFLLTMTGCARHRPNETKVVQAYRLIDAQRTDEAIDLLEAALLDDPTNYQEKVTLASAYAHKAGFKVQRLVEVMNQTKALSQLKNPPAKPAPGSSEALQIDYTLGQLDFSLSRFISVSRVYQSIPSLKKADIVYLRQAVQILASLGKEIHPGDALYRGALRIVLFKSLLSEEFIGDAVVPTTSVIGTSLPESPRCLVNIGAMNDSLQILGNTLVDIFSDMSLANPKNGKDLMRLADTTTDSVSALTLTTTSALVLDEVSKVVLKQTLLQYGFGKLIRCGGDGSPSHSSSGS